MRQATTFVVLGLACGYLAWQSGGGAAFLWGISAWSFLGLALAYALKRPQWLGKRPDGLPGFWALALLFW